LNDALLLLFKTAKGFDECAIKLFAGDMFRVQKSQVKDDLAEITHTKKVVKSNSN
jgi:hypothetical protein